MFAAHPRRAALRLGSVTEVPVADPGAAQHWVRSAHPMLWVVATLACLLVLSGCGSSTSGESAAPDVATRTITDIEGTTVEVPIAPQRVVTLSEPTLDGALALGVVPVGTVSGRGQSGAPGYLGERTDGIELLGSIAQPNFEAIGAARPDLILVDGTSINNNPPVIEALRRIAPTAYVGYAGGDWRMTFANVADALNRSEQAADVLAAYDDAVSEAKAALSPEVLASTFSIVRWQGGSAAMILKELPPGQALNDLGLARPPAQDRNGRGHSEPVSLENLAQIDADYIFFGTLGGSSVDNPNAGGSADADAANDALRSAEQTPGFTSLSAYTNDRIIPVDGSLWTSTGGPLLMRSIINDVLEALK